MNIKENFILMVKYKRASMILMDCLMMALSGFYNKTAPMISTELYIIQIIFGGKISFYAMKKYNDISALQFLAISSDFF
jgi:hypothetical protein